MQCQTIRPLETSPLHILAFVDLTSLHLISLFVFFLKGKKKNHHFWVKAKNDSLFLNIKIPPNIILGEQPNQIYLLQSCCFYFYFIF